MDIYDTRIDVTKEIIKTRPSNSGTRREYARMRLERSVSDLQGSSNQLCTYEEKLKLEPRKSITVEDAIKEQENEPEVKTFPFEDQTDSQSCPKDKAVEAQSHLKHRHGARLCMVSAVIHMKCAAQRRAKSMQQLKKNPKTTLDEKLLKESNAVANDSDDSEEEDDVNDLRKCRYLRGVQHDRELTIEEIFG